MAETFGDTQGTLESHLQEQKQKASNERKEKTKKTSKLMKPLEPEGVPKKLAKWLVHSALGLAEEDVANIADNEATMPAVAQVISSFGTVIGEGWDKQSWMKPQMLSSTLASVLLEFASDRIEKKMGDLKGFHGARRRDKVSCQGGPARRRGRSKPALAAALHED